jgi:tetratricopeptide (TPR) repeat protein
VLGRLLQTTCFLLLLIFFAGCKRNVSDSKVTAEQGTPADEFLRLMNAGKNYLDQGDPTNALAVYRRAHAITPNDADLHLNMAIAHLIAGASADAIRESDEVLKLEPNSAAAWFIKGSAHLRLSQFEEAAKSLENAKKIDPGESATFFQLGAARMGLQQWDSAITAFQEGIKLEPNRLHASAHYLLGQALLRAGRQEEAQQELLQHQSNLEATGSAPNFERSKHTVPRVPFKLAQPGRDGVKVSFADATETAFGNNAQRYSGPLAVIDPNHTGWNSLFVLDRENDTSQFRLLWNSNGTFHASSSSYPASSGASYSKMLVGDLQNDRFEDIIVLGENGSHLFKFETNGVASDVTHQSRLSDLRAIDGTLMDLDFLGKLDLLAVTTTNLHLFRQFGALIFSNITSTSGILALTNAQSVVIESWNRDENMDVIVGRRDAAPLLLEKQRGGPLRSIEGTNWIAGTAFATGDFDNDLRADLAILSSNSITICFNGGNRREIKIPAGANLHSLRAIDYDNDGWLDLWAFGQNLRAWRNVGLAGFDDQSQQLGLNRFFDISEIHFADFDLDCDSDAILALRSGGLRYLRNDGANANTQVKVRLIGNRSNASGIGSRVEIQTGELRLIRTIDRLPVEIGVGQYKTLDSLLVHWFNWPQGTAEWPVNCKEPFLALELTLQEGSCPYLYAWDGTSFRFITDILGAAPLGLPLAAGRYIDSDPEEFVWIGNEQTFPPRNGSFQLQITEELREVLYLDEAKLVVIDHEPGLELHTTDKLLPGKPFPPATFLALHNEHPLRKAETHTETDVTTQLLQIDGARVSPPELLGPQLRGLAKPHSLFLDFGPLDTTQPLVLVMNGWLRFGGGMANMAASQDPSLPFPFHTLDAEIAGEWKPIDVTVGAPAGKTKTILVDLEDKLPPGTQRLRLTQAFEIHWDRIALLEKKPDAQFKITEISPSEADLHYRGFSALQNLPQDWPLTPDYNRVSPNGPWTLIPGGWCTRYGDVSELIARRDEALALINAGDELTLKFSANSLPQKPSGHARQFFLYVDGWDKDSDFHVATGTQVEPLPFHGMNDQLYGQQPRPKFPSDELHRKYNTRWVDGKALKQAQR